MFLVRYWRGEGSLSQLFWLYGVAFSGVVIGLVGWAAATARIGDELLVAAIVLLFAYTAWILVSVWRCAARRGEDDAYCPLVRGLTVAWAINAVLVGGFVLFEKLA
jgi:heme O synthase-like polyprenyltransferase